MRHNYIQVKNLTEDSADIYFYGDIVNDEWSKWSDSDTAPEDVLAVLDQAKDKSQLNIFINSGGGSVFAGIAIYNILKRYQGYKTVYVDGLAASIASVIAMVGDKIIIPANAYAMIHKPWNIVAGNSNDFRKMADDLDKIEEGILNIYAGKLRDGVDIEVIKQMVNDETWLDGKTAAKYFDIEIVESNQAAACITDTIKSYHNVPAALLELNQVENAVDTDEIDKLKIQLELL